MIIWHKLLHNKIRQIQIPIYNKTQKIGYLVRCPWRRLYGSSKLIWSIDYCSLDSNCTFLIARFIAGRSIKPISSIIETSNIITKDNLSSRIPLPQNRDELYVLSKTIKYLTESKTQSKEKNSSDASHELRTPLTIIKGLEVLIRKPRNSSEYEEKINFCFYE
jgi:signal transduction histidine kinase